MEIYLLKSFTHYSLAPKISQWEKRLSSSLIMSRNDKLISIFEKYWKKGTNFDEKNPEMIKPRILQSARYYTPFPKNYYIYECWPLSTKSFLIKPYFDSKVRLLNPSSAKLYPDKGIPDKLLNEEDMKYDAKTRILKVMLHNTKIISVHLVPNSPINTAFVTIYSHDKEYTLEHNAVITIETQGRLMYLQKVLKVGVWLVFLHRRPDREWFYIIMVELTGEGDKYTEYTIGDEVQDYIPIKSGILALDKRPASPHTLIKYSINWIGNSVIDAVQKKTVHPLYNCDWRTNYSQILNSPIESHGYLLIGEIRGSNKRILLTHISTSLKDLGSTSYHCRNSECKYSVNSSCLQYSRVLSELFHPGVCICPH